MQQTPATTASSALAPEPQEGGDRAGAPLLHELQALAWLLRRNGHDCCAQTIEQILIRLKEPSEDHHQLGP